MKHEQVGPGPAVALGGIALVAWAVIEQLRIPAEARTWNGKLAGLIPYDFRPPTLDRLQRSVWAPDDHRLLTPQPFGVGWTVNLGRVTALLRGGRS